MRTGFLTLVYGLMLSFSALATPFDNITTHNVAVPEQSFQLAATWFLPDWQASMSGRSESAPDKSGDRHDLTCSTYDGCDGVPVNMTCSENFTAAGTICYKSCSCKSGYNRVNDSDVCAGCANPCDTVTAVSAPYGCQTAWTVCPSKCQVAYPDNCHNREAAKTPYGCQEYWSDCNTKCQTAYPDNCRNREDKTTDYGCEKKWSDCSSKCETGKICTPADCSAYTLSTIPANAEYASCTPGCGNTTTTYKITSCTAGFKLYKGLCLQQTTLPILYESGTVADVIIPDKTPIAVVFDLENTRAVGFNEINEDYEWKNSPLVDRDEAPLSIFFDRKSTTFDKDEGFINTYGACTGYGQYDIQMMRDVYPAFGYACEYRKSDSSIYAGRWYLPSLQEFRTIYKQLTAINSTLKLLKKTLISTTKLYGTSSGRGMRRYAIDLRDGLDEYFETAYVRPVINYRYDKIIASCIDGKYQMLTDEESHFSCKSDEKHVFCPKNHRFFKCKKVIKCPMCHEEYDSCNDLERHAYCPLCGYYFEQCQNVCILAKDCSAYPLTANPANATYETCNAGCGTQERYKITACHIGYELSNNTCVPKTCASQGLKDCNGVCIAENACCGNYSETRSSYTPYNGVILKAQYSCVSNGRTYYSSFCADQCKGKGVQVPAKYATGFCNNGELARYSLCSYSNGPCLVCK